MKICIIIPFFGALPPWSNLFFMSCGYSPSIHFKIFTDDDRAWEYPENVEIIPMKFLEMQNLLKDKLKKLGGGYLGFPYKLCDYRPAYGYIFEDYLSDYDYWGHCDMDTLMGNLESWLAKGNYKDYDRLLSYGHLSLYKNEEEINSLFMKKMPDELPGYMKFDFVKKTSIACHYDEVGINAVFCCHGKSFYQKNHVLNVSQFYEDFRLGSSAIEPWKQLVTFEDGKIYLYREKENGIEKEEFMYMHFMGRKQMPLHLPEGEALPTRMIIAKTGFHPLLEDETISGKHFELFAEEELLPRQVRQKSFIQKSWETLKKEIPARGLMAIHSFWERYRFQKWLAENGGDLIYESKWFQNSNHTKK